MEVQRQADIASKFIEFYLKHSNKILSEGYKLLIKNAIPELALMIDNDDFLIEPINALIIVNRLHTIPKPISQSEDEFCAEIMKFVEISPKEFCDWLQKTKSNSNLGLRFLLK